MRSLLYLPAANTGPIVCETFAVAIPFKFTALTGDNEAL